MANVKNIPRKIENVFLARFIQECEIPMVEEYINMPVAKIPDTVALDFTKAFFSAMFENAEYEEFSTQSQVTGIYLVVPKNDDEKRQHHLLELFNQDASWQEIPKVRNFLEQSKKFSATVKKEANVCAIGVSDSRTDENAYIVKIPLFSSFFERGNTTVTRILSVTHWIIEMREFAKQSVLLESEFKELIEDEAKRHSFAEEEKRKEDEYKEQLQTRLDEIQTQIRELETERASSEIPLRQIEINRQIEELSGVVADLQQQIN